MPTMKEMAKEYRRSSALLARKIRELEEAGEAEKEKITKLKQALADTRAIQRLLDSYYDLPRNPDFTCSNLKTLNFKREDDD